MGNAPAPWMPNYAAIGAGFQGRPLPPVHPSPLYAQVGALRGRLGLMHSALAAMLSTARGGHDYQSENLAQQQSERDRQRALAEAYARLGDTRMFNLERDAARADRADARQERGLEARKPSAASKPESPTQQAARLNNERRGQETSYAEAKANVAKDAAANGGLGAFGQDEESAATVEGFSLDPALRSKEWTSRAVQAERIANAKAASARASDAAARAVQKAAGTTGADANKTWRDAAKQFAEAVKSPLHPHFADANRMTEEERHQEILKIFLEKNPGLKPPSSPFDGKGGAGGGGEIGGKGGDDADVEDLVASIAIPGTHIPDAASTVPTGLPVAIPGATLPASVPSKPKFVNPFGDRGPAAPGALVNPASPAWKGANGDTATADDNYYAHMAQFDREAPGREAAASSAFDARWAGMRAAEDIRQQDAQRRAANIMRGDHSAGMETSGVGGYGRNGMHYGEDPDNVSDRGVTDLSGIMAPPPVKFTPDQTKRDAAALRDASSGKGQYAPIPGVASAELLPGQNGEPPALSSRLEQPGGVPARHGRGTPFAYMQPGQDAQGNAQPGILKTGVYTQSVDPQTGEGRVFRPADGPAAAYNVASVMDEAGPHPNRATDPHDIAAERLMAKTPEERAAALDHMDESPDEYRAMGVEPAEVRRRLGVLDQG